jgi:hypothetical protein
MVRAPADCAGVIAAARTGSVAAPTRIRLARRRIGTLITFLM